MPTISTFPQSNGQSSHLETPQTTPLRKRENDSFSSPEAPLLWRQSLQPANGALHNHTNYSPSLAASSSHYADLNFAHMSRRRGRHGSRSGAQFWVPWVMKAILASPLIVVLFWIIAVAFHHPTESSTMTNNRFGVTSKNTRNLMRHKQEQQKSLLSAAHHNPSNSHQGADKKKIPVYVPMGVSEGQHQMVPEIQPQQLLMPQSGWRMPFMQANQPMVQGQNGYMQNQMQMMQPQMMMPGQNMMQLSQQQPGQLYQQPQLIYQQLQPQMYQQAQPQMMQAQPQYMSVQNQFEFQQQPNQYSEQTENQPMLMAARVGRVQNQRPAHPVYLRGKQNTGNVMKDAANEQAKIYYYDPAQAIVHGKLQAPSIVYDEHGNEIELASLMSFGSDVLMEPPLTAPLDSPEFGSTGDSRRLIISSNSTNSTSTGPIPILPPPPMEMKFKTPEAWGESTTQDQSIIIVTVATMALLVGALSARRLRSRSFLSSCIENESLEDEVAYDNAYTIAGGDSYNTFGWKGDLEKFDV